MSNAISMLRIPRPETRLLDIRELVRSGERVRYLTKKERLALIRGILAADEADEVAFLAGERAQGRGGGEHCQLPVSASCGRGGAGQGKAMPRHLKD